MRRFLPAFALCTLVSLPALNAQDPVADLAQRPRARVLVLGTFHFQDAGLDAYRPEFAFDIRDPEHQRELEEVLAMLAAWRPTRIAVEQMVARQGRLDSLYAVYPGGGLDTLRNEIYQMGFRLAKRLGHPGVYAVDAPARRLDSAMTEAEWNRRRAALRTGPLNATNWDALFRAVYRVDDSLKTALPLAEILRRANDPDRLTLGHGHYLVGNLLNGEPGDYLGADGFVSGWYNRNLRIYSNVARLIRSPEERVLLIIGAGHAPILRHLLASSPVAGLVEVPEVLK